MVAVRSNKEMELTPALTPIAPYKSQTADGNVISFFHCMHDPQPEGHMAIHIGRCEFINAVWRCRGVAARGARATTRRCD